MVKQAPIKNIDTIYRYKENNRGLLLFLLGINTDINIMKYKIYLILQWLFSQDSVDATLKFTDEKEDLNFRFREGACLC